MLSGRRTILLLDDMEAILRIGAYLVVSRILRDFKNVSIKGMLWTGGCYSPYRESL